MTEFDKALADVKKAARPQKNNSWLWDTSAAQSMVDQMITKGRVTVDDGARLINQIKLSRKNFEDHHKTGLFVRHRVLFSFMIFAFVLGVILDLIPASSSIENRSYASFAIPSLLVIVYFLGLSAGIRFLAQRSWLNRWSACLVTFLLMCGWSLIQAAIEGADSPEMRVSILFYVCIIACYKTLRFRSWGEVVSND